jgi:hypothetical protein
MGIIQTIKPKLKVGFIVNSRLLEQHSLDLMDAVSENNTLFESPAIIYIDGAGSRPSRLIQSIREWLRNALAHIVSKIEISRVRNNPIYKNYFLFMPALDSFSKRSSMHQTSLDSLSTEYFDILINCSSSGAPESILQYSAHGVIQSCEEDFKVKNTLLIGLLDVLHGFPASSLIITRRDSNSTEHFTICSGEIMTRSLWHHNRAALLNKRNAFILGFLQKINNTNIQFDSPINLNESIANPKKTSSLYLIKYLLRIYPKLIFKAAIQLLQISKKFDRWSVAYLRGDGFGQNFSLAIEIKNQPGRFFADPFVICHNNRTICFVEDFFYAESKGKISAIEILEDGYNFLGVVLEENFHLSYPFIFEDDGEVYMIPESSEANEIRLYQAVDFPLVWEFKQLLMEEVSAVDTCIFQEENLWFMLTNICSSDGDDHSSELHIFYTDQLYSSNWDPIKSHNPVIFNSQKARNGGFFELNNKKYRVNQVQGFTHYGKSFAVNYIKNISQDFYEEDFIFEMQPDFLEDVISTHHFHTNGKFAVFDYCKNEKISN